MIPLWPLVVVMIVFLMIGLSVYFVAGMIASLLIVRLVEWDTERRKKALK
jgi:hypothetical protein